MSRVLAFDIGGTKILAAVVSEDGQILDTSRAAVTLDYGPAGLLEQIGRIGDELLAKCPDVKAVGLASAGPLDPLRGEWTDPTNMKTQGRSWGVVPVVAPLEARWKRKVRLDNDAASGALAEQAWGGHGDQAADFVVVTLGTGLGVGVICNGALVRAGRGLHPEAGHLILNAGDTSAPCGCGNLGCAEAYLSATGFARRANRRALPQVNRSAKEWSEAVDRGEAAALAAFEDYAQWLSVFVHNLCVVYAPKTVVLTGSFAAAHAHFLDRTKALLMPRLAERRKGHDYLPKFSLSSLGNNACLLGGARLALLIDLNS